VRDSSWGHRAAAGLRRSCRRKARRLRQESTIASWHDAPLAMSITVNLQPKVRDWIAQNLGRGVPQELMKHDTEARLASAMVQAVAQ
jgi:hypothetical protein